MCYAVYAVQGASLMWSPLALAAIAVDRYLLVSFPFKKQIDNRTCLLIICGIWLGALLILAPMLVHVHYFDVSECYQYCVEIWPDERVLRFLYGLTVLTIRSAIPLATIAFCHWRIACVLNEQTTRLQTMRSMSTLRHAVDIRKKQRLQKLLLMMVIIFGVSSFPLDLFNVVQDLELAYRTQLFPQQFKQVAFLITHWFAMAGTLCNPLVYAWWNDNFRKETQKMIAEFRQRFRVQHPFDRCVANETSTIPKRRRCTIPNEKGNELKNDDRKSVGQLVLKDSFETSFQNSTSAV
ncbi:Neuropeptide FF receptor 2 [Toxocara canis]|uniref:Neuropeptide FF receptor 2 n=1 Tax=Toxocara canis TaxID=6265 RepID=A0A0B2UX71_TOXCA|nr:Neuropeptide FF receptor 2 [Toxocara canis]